MVDTVLYFEGERGHQFRILRAVKNRFGPTDEIGVFEMTDRGLSGGRQPLAPCSSPSGAADVSGAAVFAGIEGTRPVLVEIQALVGALARSARRAAPWSAGTPTGWPWCWPCSRRAAALSIGASDVYLNVAGGLRIGEPAADLAVAAAARVVLGRRTRCRADMVVFGEIGLAGEVRPVSQREARLKEAAKLGFRSALVPRARSGASGASPRAPEGIIVDEIEHLSDLVARFQPADRPPKSVRREGAPERRRE